MASLRLLSSRDGVEVVAALLGHARATPASSGNVRALDRIFDEVVDSLRMGLPLRAEIEAGASAVATVLNALHDMSEPTHANHGLPLVPSNPDRPLPPHFPSHPRASQQASSQSTGSVASLPGASRLIPQQRLRRIAQRPGHPQPQLPTTHPQQIAPQHLAQQAYPQSHAMQPVQYPPHLQQKMQAQRPITSNAVSHQLPSAGTSYGQPASTSRTRARISRQPSLATDATASSEAHLPPARRAVRKKRYHDAVPSTHCHVCCRPSTTVPMAVCSNIKEGTCRKVVCNRCILDNGWNWDEAISESSSWICPHCADSCTQVPRAQCWVYMRTNSRRRMNGLRNKKMRTTAPEQTSGVGSGAALSQSVPAGMHGAHATNGTTQAPMHAVAPSRPMHRGGYPVDYRAVVQPRTAVGYVAVHGEMVDGARQHRMEVGGPHLERGGRGRGGRVGGRTVDAGGMEAKKPR